MGKVGGCHRFEMASPCRTQLSVEFTHFRQNSPSITPELAFVRLSSFFFSPLSLCFGAGFDSLVRVWPPFAQNHDRL